MNGLKIRFGVLVVSALIVNTAFAEISRVRVVNEADRPIYIHKGGYAPSFKIKPGESHIFFFPFQVIPPNTNKPITSSKLVATAGGKWMTTPNGVTYLDKPTLTICLDYASTENKTKEGNRVWSIKSSVGIEVNCKVEGYKQPWYQP
jgi:hypothetical protein